MYILESAFYTYLQLQSDVAYMELKGDELASESQQRRWRTPYALLMDVRLQTNSNRRKTLQPKLGRSVCDAPF